MAEKITKIKKLNRQKVAKYSRVMQLKDVDWDKVKEIFSIDRKLLNEQLSRKEILTANAHELLPILAGGTVIALSFLIPIAPMVLGPFILKDKFKRGVFGQTLERFKKQKLVKVVEENGMTVVKITNRGRIRALRYKLDKITIQKPQKWDKKWRLVIFDIPETHKMMREVFRHYLKRLNFYQLQKSVWVHPYPCFDEIEFLRQLFGVGINVSYILAERIEDSDDLKSHFKLS